jgi:ABC-type polysaccharide/polyol phosphate export permease
MRVRLGAGSSEATGGVSALVVKAKRSWVVLWTLAVADLRARYGRGRIRLVKWLFDPFAAVGVYLLLVTLILDEQGTAPGLSIACAVVSFQIVLMTMINAMDAYNSRSTIVLNMGFPRLLLPAASTLTESIAFAGSLLLLVMMIVIYGVSLTVSILWFPLVLAINLLFAVACAYPITLAGVWYPEMKPFVLSVSRTAFFLAPSLIPLSQITGSVADWIKLNPLTGLFEGYRDALLYGQAPAAWELLYPLAISLLLLSVFVPLYRREQLHLAKMI